MLKGFIDLRPTGRRFDFETARIEADLRARSRGAVTSPVETVTVEPEPCAHVRTGRERQSNLFGGSDVVCAACGAIVREMSSPALD